ncbi:MAG: Phosphoglycerate kinase [Candidatus Adlerbacteria bacterium]|nr:Phosphoglycerate kinase [Candidatus Adlerbacteria bacterium]
MQENTSSKEIKKITDADVRGKKVLLRTSLNVPIAADGSVGDMFRLKAALPTIEHLSKNGARTIVIAHLGRAGDTLEPVVKELTKLLPNVSIKFVGGALADAAAHISEMKDGECVVLENVRTNDGEEKNDPALAQQFASLGEMFVNDAFADSHRTHASVVGVAQLLPSYAGLLMQSEVEHLTPALTPPQGAVAIIGGAKFETKEPLISKLLERHYTKVLLGGALANDGLKARGMPFGASLVSDTVMPTALATDDRIVLPMDGVFQDVDANAEREAYVTDVRATEKIVDIGSYTAKAWVNEILSTPLLVWNGPTGIYELGFVSGTEILAHAVSEMDGKAVVGGGDTLAALQKHTFDTNKVFLSTGGGAMLEFLTTGTLVGLDALRNSSAKIAE